MMQIEDITDQGTLTFLEKLTTEELQVIQNRTQSQPVESPFLQPILDYSQHFESPDFLSNAFQLIQTSILSPGFKHFHHQAKETPYVYWVIANFPSPWARVITCKNPYIFLSGYTLWKGEVKHGQSVKYFDYVLAQLILDKGEVIDYAKDGYHLAFSLKLYSEQTSKRRIMCVLKTTEDRRECFLQTFYVSDGRDRNKMLVKKQGNILRDALLPSVEDFLLSKMGWLGKLPSSLLHEILRYISPKERITVVSVLNLSCFLWLYWSPEFSPKFQKRKDLSKKEIPTSTPSDKLILYYLTLHTREATMHGLAHFHSSGLHKTNQKKSLNLRHK